MTKEREAGRKSAAAADLSALLKMLRLSPKMFSGEYMCREYGAGRNFLSGDDRDYRKAW